MQTRSTVILLAALGGLAPLAPLALADLEVSVVTAAPTGAQVIVAQPYGRKGPTSATNLPLIDAANREAKQSPVQSMDRAYNSGQYWRRDRDLGQTFTYNGTVAKKLDAITLRYGAVTDGSTTRTFNNLNVSLQILSVSGTPAINKNGTTNNEWVSDPYDNPQTRDMADDYITGENYTSMTVARNGLLPATLSTGRTNTVTPTTDSQGSLMRWDLTGADEVILQPGSTYAFLVMFDNDDSSHNFQLDNYDYLNMAGYNESQAEVTPYTGGHAIRREGSIEHPYLHMADVFNRTGNNAAVLDGQGAHNLPTDWNTRIAMQPGTWGRPDVDTYRDLVFWVEATPVPEPAGALTLLGLGSLLLQRLTHGQRE